jgi:hypothetical protein
MTGDRVVILADRADTGARLLAADIGDRAVVATPADLSRPGWTYRPEPRRRQAMTVDGPITVDDIAVVVTRLTAVFDMHVMHVVPADRGYVAAEMTAFLRAWLDGLAIPVVDPPSTTSLSGPAWTLEQWAQQSARVGVPFVPIRRTIPAVITATAPPSDLRQVQVAGDALRTVGPVSNEEIDWTRRLAGAAEVHFLTLTLDPDAALVATATTWADLNHPDVRDLYRTSLAVVGAKSTVMA